MRTVPRRFLLTYAVAFGLLYLGGIAYEKRSLDPEWGKFRLQPHIVKRDNLPTTIRVYILSGEGDDPTEFVVTNEVTQPNPPDLNDIPGTAGRIVGIVDVWKFSHRSVAGPFLQRNGYSIDSAYEPYYEPKLNQADLETAKGIAYREARLWFEVPYFAQTDLRFMPPDGNESLVASGPITGGKLIPRMPCWALISLFAFAPLAAARTVTSATTRAKRTESPPSPLEGKGGREADG